MTTPEGLNELHENHFDILKKAKDKGVAIKIATNESEKCADAVKAFSSISEIRNINEKEVPIAGRFTVVDEKELILALTDHKVHETQNMTLWSKSDHAAGEVLEPLFRLVWSHSKAVS